MIYTIRVGALIVKISAMTAFEAVEEAKKRMGDYKCMIIDMKRIKGVANARY